MYFEWDEKKAAINKRDHGISFRAAALVFEDEYRIPEEDSVADGEQRWRTIGIAEGITVVLVVYLEEVWSEDIYVRIISARRATPGERRDYEQNRALFDR